MRITTAHYRDAKQRGAAWLLDQLHPDGSIGDQTEGFRFYRVPWTFTVAAILRRQRACAAGSARTC